MKLDIKKQTYTVYNNYLGLPFEISRCSSWKLSSKARIAWGTFQPASSKVKTKAMHPKSDFRLWQPAHFPTKNSINKPLYFSFALPFSVHSSSVSFCLPAFFTIIFSPSSRSDSFYLLSFISKPVARYNCATLRHVISRQKISTFPYPKSQCGLLSTTRKVRTDGRTIRHNQIFRDG